jgi:hypothetical protein
MCHVRRDKYHTFTIQYQAYYRGLPKSLNMDSALPFSHTLHPPRTSQHEQQISYWGESNMPNPFHNTQETQAELLAESALNLTAKNSTKPATKNTAADIAPLFLGPLKLGAGRCTPRSPDTAAARTQSLLFQGVELSTIESFDVHGTKKDGSTIGEVVESVSASREGQNSSGKLSYHPFRELLLTTYERSVKVEGGDTS